MSYSEERTLCMCPWQSICSLYNELCISQSGVPPKAVLGCHMYYCHYKYLNKCFSIHIVIGILSNISLVVDLFVVLSLSCVLGSLPAV